MCISKSPKCIFVFIKYIQKEEEANKLNLHSASLWLFHVLSVHSWINSFLLSRFSYILMLLLNIKLYRWTKWWGCLVKANNMPSIPASGNLPAWILMNIQDYFRICTLDRGVDSTVFHQHRTWLFIIYSLQRVCFSSFLLYSSGFQWMQQKNCRGSAHC